LTFSTSRDRQINYQIINFDVKNRYNLKVSLKLNIIFSHQLINSFNEKKAKLKTNFVGFYQSFDDIFNDRMR
jgi:hypothetical protein